MKQYIAKAVKVIMWAFFAIGVGAVTWIMISASPQDYMTIEMRQIVIGFVVKGALAFIGFFGIRAAFLHLISTLRKNNFVFHSELPKAIFYSAIFFALAFFLALILI